MQQKSVSSDRRSSQAAPTDDSVEPMHRGARAEVDDSPDGPRQPSSTRGALQSERGPTNPGGTAGEHSGQKPERNADRGDDEAPETPTDEPSPIPVQDPPSGDRARPPLTVRGGRP
jgi:hypothetical protein